MLSGMRFKTRLVGDPLDKARVELYYDVIPEWGTICPDNWNANMATDVCKEHGYGLASAVVTMFQNNYYNGTGRTFLRVFEKSEQVTEINGYQKAPFEPGCPCKEPGDLGVICASMLIPFDLCTEQCV